jgi:hypothetical protein
MTIMPHSLNILICWEIAGPADIKSIRNGVEVHGFPGDHVNDLSPGGIGNGLEYIPAGFK